MLYTCLIALMFVFAIQAIREQRLIVSALWLAATSAVLSVVLYSMSAYRVAVIELSVGAGLVTVLFVFAINISGEESITARSLLPRPVSLGLVVMSVLLLAWLVLRLDHTETQATEPEFAAVLWEDRGLDVLVQIVLIFAGTLGLLGLLAEAKAPLEYPVAEEVAAERDRDLLALQDSVYTEPEMEEEEAAIVEGELV